MTGEWLLGSYTVMAAARRPDLVLLVDEVVGDYSTVGLIAQRHEVEIELRASEMGRARTDANDVAMITALVTDVSVNLAASAIWAAIVSSVHGILRARRAQRDAEQRFVLTVVVPTSSGDRIVESEVVGEGSIDAGLAATERIVSEILGSSARD